MFSIMNKLRTLIALGAAGAALAGGGVASAATLVHTPGTGTTVVAGQPTTVYLDPGKYGSATTGVSDADCENLAEDYNHEMSTALEAEQEGERDIAHGALQLAYAAQTKLENNCFVMD